MAWEGFRLNSSIRGGYGNLAFSPLATCPASSASLSHPSHHQSITRMTYLEKHMSKRGSNERSLLVSRGVMFRMPEPPLSTRRPAALQQQRSAPNVKQQWSQRFLARCMNGIPHACSAKIHMSIKPFTLAYLNFGTLSLTYQAIPAKIQTLALVS